MQSKVLREDTLKCFTIASADNLFSRDERPPNNRERLQGLAGERQRDREIPGQGHPDAGTNSITISCL